MKLSRLIVLADRWREEGSLLRLRGASPQADTLESAALELETVLTEWSLEKLTLAQAAEEASQTYDSIQRKVATGMLHNAGQKGAPRVRRCDLFGIETSKHPSVQSELGSEILATRRAGQR